MYSGTSMAGVNGFTRAEGNYSCRPICRATRGHAHNAIPVSMQQTKGRPNELQYRTPMEILVMTASSNNNAIIHNSGGVCE